MNALLILFHCPINTGYAIRTLEHRFYETALRLTGDPAKIHLAYSATDQRRPEALPDAPYHLLAFDARHSTSEDIRKFADYIRRHRIDVILGFDHPLRLPYYPAARKAGVRTLVSYYGAPMSSIGRGPVHALRKLRARFSRFGPDHYIFESEAMAATATTGSGIARSRVSVVHLGVDTEVFHPQAGPRDYIHRALGIPHDRRIIYYSGHMEERKGVSVLMQASRLLYRKYNRRDFHTLVLGNRPGEERPFLEMLQPADLRSHVTFGGYRSDVSQLLPGCFVGVIPSTGWDSFTMSALEIAASGLPLIVSDLQGLAETIDPGRTGFTFKPGKPEELASHICLLLDDPVRRSDMASQARRRTELHFTAERQVSQLAFVLASLDTATG